MPQGPGKYDRECSLIRKMTDARCAIVIVIDGNKGTGFACQVVGDMVPKMPELLETVAKEMRESING